MYVKQVVIYFFLLSFLSGCVILNRSHSTKSKFTDGIYYTDRFSRHEVYVLKIDDDTTAVFPVKEYKDSTQIIVNERVNYTPVQRKFKYNKTNPQFYRQSLDVNLVTIPLKYRPYADGLPNQLTSNFNGAVYFGYRTDYFQLKYRRTPLNLYKQEVRHLAYSVGAYGGAGSTLVSPWVIRGNFPNIEYEGVTFTAGVATNIAIQNFTFGISLGAIALRTSMQHTGSMNTSPMWASLSD
jgi:hypothetical protein